MLTREVLTQSTNPLFVEMKKQAFVIVHDEIPTAGTRLAYDVYRNSVLFEGLSYRTYINEAPPENQNNPLPLVDPFFKNVFSPILGDDFEATRQQVYRKYLQDVIGTPFVALMSNLEPDDAEPLFLTQPSTVTNLFCDKNGVMTLAITCYDLKVQNPAKADEEDLIPVPGVITATYKLVENGFKLEDFHTSNSFLRLTCLSNIKFNPKSLIDNQAILMEEEIQGLRSQIETTTDTFLKQQAQQILQAIEALQVNNNNVLPFRSVPFLITRLLQRSDCGSLIFALSKLIKELTEKECTDNERVLLEAMASFYLCCKPTLVFRIYEMKNKLRMPENKHLENAGLSLLLNVALANRKGVSKAILYETLSVAYKTISQPTAENVEACRQLIKKLLPLSWGKRIAGSLGMLVGALVIGISVGLMVVTHGFSTPLSILGIKVGVGLTSAGYGLVFGGAIGIGAGVTLGGSIGLFRTVKSDHKKQTKFQEVGEDLKQLTQQITPAPVR